jgi:hypothetical protein
MPRGIMQDLDQYLAAVHSHLAACQVHCGITHDRAVDSPLWHEAVAATLEDVRRTWQVVQRLAGEEKDTR